MGGPRFHVAQFIKAIPGTAGIVTAIAKRVGCTWHTARRYIDRHPTVAAAYQDECETLTDVAEVKLYAQINAGEMWAVKYYLSTKGKNRGYTTRTEHTGADGGAIPVELRHLYGMTDDELRAEHRRLAAELASSEHIDEAAGADASAESPAPLDAESRAADGGPPY